LRAIFCGGAGFGVRPTGFFRQLSLIRQFWLLVLAAFPSLAGCHSPAHNQALHRYDFTHPAMGTLFTINLYAPDQSAAQAAADAAFQRVDDLEDIMSDYQADSELLRLCDQPYGRPVPVSDDLFDVLERAQKIAALSDGAFDATVGPYVRLWRFSRKRKVLPTPAELAGAKAAVGWQKARLDRRDRSVTLLVPNMRLDLGGIGKGYAADQALKLLQGRGIDRALVAASGDIAVGHPPPGHSGWRIGIATFGTRTNEIARSVVLQNAGISTSGDSEQFVEINGVRYSHIVNPRTGLGLTNPIQATIIGPDATTTDSLDTTVSVLGVTRGLQLVDSMPRTAALISKKESGEVQTFVSRRFPRIEQAR
jgi:thiamine biosynthesis lipoprotein